MSVFGVILVHIFPYSDWIRTRITQNMNTFYAVEDLIKTRVSLVCQVTFSLKIRFRANEAMKVKWNPQSSNWNLPKPNKYQQHSVYISFQTTVKSVSQVCLFISIFHFTDIPERCKDAYFLNFMDSTFFTSWIHEIKKISLNLWN